MTGLDGVAWALVLFDLLVSGRALVLHVQGRIKPHQVSGWWALGDGAVLLGCVLARIDVLWTAWVAGIFAWNLYVWWTGGGDDDTKRRLRKLGRAFTGIRRTAPAGA